MQEINDQAEEYSLLDIIKISKEFIYEIRRNLWVVFLSALIIGGVLAIRASFQPTLYLASVTFSVNEDESQDITGISGLLSAFGGGGKGEKNLEKILQLFNSRRIILNSLFNKSILNGKDDFLANHIINNYGLDGLKDPYESVFPWESYPPWIERLDGLDIFSFKSRLSTTDSLKDPVERVMLNILYDKMAGKSKYDIDPMIGSMVDEASGIMRISITSNNEDLTIGLVKVLYENLSQYYIDNTVEKQKRVYQIARFKADSIRNELLTADRKLAEFLDGHRNLVWVRGQLTQQKLQREARILELMYGEVIKQLELADFSLRRKTPYVSFIDLPSKPLTPIITSKFRAFILGFLLGIGLSIVFLILRKIILDTIEKEQKNFYSSSN